MLLATHRCYPSRTQNIDQLFAAVVLAVNGKRAASNERASTLYNSGLASPLFKLFHLSPTCKLTASNAFSLLQDS